MTASELVSFYSTISESTPMTGTTTVSLGKTQNVTATVPECLTSTLHLTKL